MEKWKRLSAAVMAAAMLFPAAACGKAPDAKAALDAAVTQNAGLTSVDMETLMVITLTLGERKRDFSTNMNIRMTDINQDTMQYLAAVRTSMAGQSVDMTIFYTDGYYYMEALGKKSKYPMDPGQLLETLKKSTNSPALTSGQMTEVALAKTGGNTVISFTADPAEMNAYVKAAMSGLAAPDTGVEEMTVRNVTGAYTLNQEGYYTDMTMKMDIDMTVQGKNAAMTIETACKVNDPGRPVVLELPSTDGYQEIDPPAAAA